MTEPAFELSAEEAVLPAPGSAWEPMTQRRVLLLALQSHRREPVAGCRRCGRYAAGRATGGGRDRRRRGCLRNRLPHHCDPGPCSGLDEYVLLEAIAMADLTRERDFAWVLAFHTQGEVIYWGYQGLEPPYSETMVNEFSRVSGYEPVQTIESYAGYKDWFIQDWRRPGFTVELGFGTNPLPIRQFNEIYEETLGIFLAGLYL